MAEVTEIALEGTLEVVGETASTNVAALGSDEQSQRASLLHEKAKDARKRIDGAMFEMAEVLHEIYDDALYVKLGYKTWKEYVEQELDFAIRKAQYLVQMWGYYGVKLGGHPEVREKIQEVGWSKAKELIDVVNENNVDEWVSKAKSMSSVQLIELARNTMKALEEGEGTETSKKVDAFKNKSFRLAPEQLSNVEAALTRSGELSSSDKPGNQLDLICTDFLATNAGTGKGKSAVQALLKKVEANLGVLIVAIDSESNGVVYGDETIEKLLG